MSDTITAYELTSARTHIMRSEPDTVVLRLEYGKGESVNLELSRDEFTRFATQMSRDAAMLGADTDAKPC